VIAYLRLWRGIPTLTLAALVGLLAAQVAELARWLAEVSAWLQDRGNTARDGMEPR
jgi:hypothetical protein